jgi:hypothetical protein
LNRGGRDVRGEAADGHTADRDAFRNGRGRIGDGRCRSYEEPGDEEED